MLKGKPSTPPESSRSNGSGSNRALRTDNNTDDENSSSGKEKATLPADEDPLLKGLEAALGSIDGGLRPDPAAAMTRMQSAVEQRSGANGWNNASTPYAAPPAAATAAAAPPSSHSELDDLLQDSEVAVNRAKIDDVEAERQQRRWKMEQRESESPARAAPAEGAQQWRQAAEVTDSSSSPPPPRANPASMSADQVESASIDDVIEAVSPLVLRDQSKRRVVEDAGTPSRANEMDSLLSSLAEIGVTGEASNQPQLDLPSPHQKKLRHLESDIADLINSVSAGDVYEDPEMSPAHQSEFAGRDERVVRRFGRQNSVSDVLEHPEDLGKSLYADDPILHALREHQGGAGASERPQPQHQPQQQPPTPSRNRADYAPQRSTQEQREFEGMVGHLEQLDMEQNLIHGIVKPHGSESDEDDK